MCALFVLVQACLFHYKGKNLHLKQLKATSFIWMAVLWQTVQRLSALLHGSCFEPFSVSFNMQITHVLGCAKMLLMNVLNRNELIVMFEPILPNLPKQCDPSDLS